MGSQNFSSHDESFNTIVVLALGLLLFFGNSVQVQHLIWAKKAGGDSGIYPDSGSDIGVDASGNSYVIGNFGGIATFGEGETNETILNSVDRADIFLAKYNTDGLLLWATQAGGDSLDSGSAIAIDSSGNSYVTGLFEASATFGAGEGNETILTSTGSRDIFLAKYSANGRLLWATQAGGSKSNDHAEAIIVDASGNSYLTGFFNDSTTFGAGEINETTLSSAGSFDIFTAKYDAEGLLLWAKVAGGPSFDLGAGISLDAFNNSYVAGFFEGAATFGVGEANDTTLTSAGSPDIFVAKYNSDGLLLWVKQAGGSGDDEGFEIAVDASGNSYVTGQFEGTATFGAGEANETSLTSADAGDLFVAKYNADGMLFWAKQAGGSEGDRGLDIGVDASGNSYLTGHFERSATFGAGEANETTLSSLGANDIFVAKYNAEGLLLWAKQAGGNASAGGLGDLGIGIGLDASGNSYVTGHFDGSATFGAGEAGETTLTGAGASDIFVAKYGESPTSVVKTPILINDFQLAQNYPNPFNPVTTIVFEVSQAMQVTLVVYNLRGQLIRTLVSGEVMPGQHQVIWNGKDDRDRDVAGGLYFYKLNVGEFATIKKMILLQ